MAVIQAESNFNAKAMSPKSAQGLMQLIPATAERFGVSDPWDPHQNLQGGMAYLRWLLDYFNGDVRLALAGYNAGERAVERYGDVPPYKETRNYLRRIARILGVPADKLTSLQSGSLPTVSESARSAVFAKTRKRDAKGDWASRFFAVASSD
jgi:soluble lytic murein transglycosylase-like protein